MTMTTGRVRSGAFRGCGEQVAPASALLPKKFTCGCSVPQAHGLQAARAELADLSPHNERTLVHIHTDSSIAQRKFPGSKAAGPEASGCSAAEPLDARTGPAGTTLAVIVHLRLRGQLKL